jgi:hypothetical protein
MRGECGKGKINKGSCMCGKGLNKGIREKQG